MLPHCIAYTGGGGGFMLDNPVSQVRSSPVKNRGGPLAPQTLRPFTLKQLNEAAADHPDSPLKIDGKDATQITFVACVRMLKEQNNGSDYLFEDGTASFPGHVWNERATTAANIREGDWVRVYGLLKHMQGATFVSINSLRALESFDELTYHMLQALSHHLTNDPMRPGKGPLQPTAAASLGLSAIGDDSDRLLSPIQRAVIQVYDKATSEVGLHINSALQSLRSQYSEADIRETVNWLMNEGYLYQTIDSLHAKSAMSG